MKMAFCLIPADKFGDNGMNVGYRYVKSHESDWIQAPSTAGAVSIKEYLTVGFMRGTDFYVHDNKVYTIKKSFIDTQSDTIVFACLESVQGCDQME